MGVLPECFAFRCRSRRNAIPIAEKFSNRECNVASVDLLDIAIEKLLENSKRHGVEEHITGIVQTIDDFKIERVHMI